MSPAFSRTAPARTAGFRHLRASGWAVAIPVALVAYFIVGRLLDRNSAGIVLASVISCVGLAILAFGYDFGEILDSYWMVPVALSAAPLALVTSVFTDGRQWQMVVAGVLVVILAGAFISALHRTADGEGGLFTLARNFVIALIPGYNHIR